MAITFAVIVPAAGTGSRSGKEIPKQYVEILGQPILRHTLLAFAEMQECRAIVVPIDQAWRERAESAAAGLPMVRFVAGGADRQSSIANALSALPGGLDIVLVHDAARPCVSVDLIERVIGAAAERGAAVPALPINETVKRVEDDVIVETIRRSTLRIAQTPQGFRPGLLLEAYETAGEGEGATDDSSLVERLDHPVVVVEGEWENIKITRPEDFERAEQILRRRGARA